MIIKVIMKIKYSHRFLTHELTCTAKQLSHSPLLCKMYKYLDFKAIPHSYKPPPSFSILNVLDICHAWFHLYGALPSSLERKQAKKAEFEPATFRTESLGLRPLGHSDSDRTVFKSLIRQWHMNKINTWKNVYQIDHGLMCSWKLLKKKY